MSEFVETKLSCDDCGSSDARAINADGWSTCFSCNVRKPTSGERVMPTPPVSTPGMLSSITAALIEAVPNNAKGIPDRGITPIATKKYSVVVQGDRHTYPYYGLDDKHTPIAAKKRMPNKLFISEGQISQCMLFGQQAFSKGGRSIVITEGETDAMAAFQLMGNKYPAVSVRSSTSALKDCKLNYEWLDSFDNIVIAFDNDKSGHDAAKKVGELFGGKSKIMHITGDYNDPVDMLKDGARGQAIWTSTFWSAERFTPDGIVDAATCWSEVIKPIVDPMVLYPYDGLNKLTRGIRGAELVTVAAGSGLGKSQFIREIMFHVLQTTDVNIGGLFLEENIQRTVLSIMSLHANKMLHLEKVEEVEMREAFDATVGTGRVFLFDHFGSTSVENIISRVRYMNKALDCKVVFLDHLSIIVSSQENGDERKAIDEVMTKLRSLVQETGISLFLVSHLKRPGGLGHEEGGLTSLAQLRGSASIAQLSDIVLGLERNGQDDDPTERNTTRIRVLKNRFTGETGKAAAMLYDGSTGRMSEVDDTFDVKTLERAL